jgi:alginate O-acetyltransferase complex protein AlgI
MNFISFSFVFLFTIVLVARLTIGKKGNEYGYLYVLLLCSLVFYVWHAPIYVFILLSSAIFDYFAALWMYKSKHKKLFVVGSICLNLGLLAFFKYANFIIDINNNLLIIFGNYQSSAYIDILLPIGISFYTFQTMSYTIDVYRGVIKPTNNFPMFLLYISFFPQLVAGPIVRAKDFLYQIARNREVNIKVWGQGAYLLILGIFLKIVIGDNLGLLTDKYWQYGYGENVNSSIVLLSVFYFSMQILADFMGYTSIAVGIAYFLGFRLPKNFNAPYIAMSFSDFWRRWHITLSQWLRDYLYISLGGNRKSLIRTYMNLAIVMLLGGLWHGAAYVFIIWGLIHGLALIFEHAIKSSFSQCFSNKFFVFFWFMVVQVTVLIAWVFFRSDSATNSAMILNNILSMNFSLINNNEILNGMYYTIPLIIYHLRIFILERSAAISISIHEKLLSSGFMLYMIFTGYAITNVPFIYFQF